jgi:hypothetical protein
LALWFLRRRFVCEFPIGSYVKLSSAVGTILVEGPNRLTYFWKLDGPLPKLCPAVALSHQDGCHSAVALLLKAALIQVSDYRLLGGSDHILVAIASILVTVNVKSLIATHGEVYLIQLYMVKFDSDLMVVLKMSSRPKLCPGVALSHQDGCHSAVALLLKAALIQVSDYRLLGASG